ncbi:MAG: hypothetical protein CFE34_00090 [Rhodobacteraceae bacterium PARR1]|nr:MAG: hypothetical protein CFE34_00090 [Rhodobacteraceae bacterium PARR1]
MVTKEEFYKKRSQTYVIDDHEADFRYRRALDLVKGRLPNRSLNVAEIGCKFAAVRAIMDERRIAHRYTGIDLDAGALAKVTARENDVFVVADADNPIVGLENNVDLFLAMEVIEHVESPVRVLKTLKSHLAPGGMILMSVPNPYFWGEILHNLRRAPDVEGHLSSLTHINIDAICRFAGLKQVVRCGTFNRIPFTRRLFGRHKLLSSDTLFGARSMIFGLVRNEDVTVK